MGALVEVWHPQTHTFLFKDFEATILLEEVEVLLGLRRMKQGDEDNMMVAPRSYTNKAVLESFIDAREACEVRTGKGIHLQKLALWTMREVGEAGNAEELERAMKGFAICVAGALLFPSIDSVLESDQLSTVCAIWEGERLGPAVLAFLYSGLTAASSGRPLYGSMLLFTCWTDLHLKFCFSNEVPSSSRLFAKIPLKHLDNIIGLDGRVANQAPQLKTRADWREYLSDMPEDMFNFNPAPFPNRDLRSRLAPGVDLRLIGASELVLYNAHRCLPELGLARRVFEGPSHTGSTSVAGDELVLVLAMTATGRGGGAAAMGDPPATSGGGRGDDATAEGEEATAEEEEAMAEEEEAMARRRRGRQERDLPARTETGVMRPRTMWPLVVAAYRGLLAFQRERVREMGFGSILEIEPFFVDPPLIQVIRDRWDRVSRSFLFPWGHMVPSLEDVARITGLRVDGEAVTGVTYADYTDLTQQLLGLEPFGQDDHERRMVGWVALLQSLGLAGARQKADELLPAFVERAAGFARATYGQDAEDTVRADRDLRRFLVFLFGKMLFTTKGDDIHYHFLELLDDLTRVAKYAWGAALLAHTFADLSTGTGGETIVGGFAPFLQVWSYYYFPLGRAIEVDPRAVPLARRWLPLVIWEPYADYGDADQPWVVSGRGLFGRDIWVHCLNEIEPLCLRLAVRTLGLHQWWIDEAEPRGIGRKTRGNAKTVDWRTRFPEQFSDWHRGGQVVTSDATDSTAYLWRYQEEYGLRDFMRPERRAAQGSAVQAEAGGASSSRGPAVAAEVSSLQEQQATAAARAERIERDLAIRSEELESALACETLTVTELTEQRSQSAPTELPRDVAELRALLALERRDLERQQGLWEHERERLSQQAVEARAGQLAAERLLKASEDRYRHVRERAREQGRASAYSESVLASSSQYERNVQDAVGAQRSTGSRAPMGPPPPPTAAADLGEAESRQREPATLAEGGDESQTTLP
ncbi:hypothetical protein Taro_005406 [Colocasia esculenta]|uniref:Aminotransferase-like plant mobile domain-containing protein n=1 Tax=Colocasia esculenta TaxID=4460 RepID=A0A843TUH2_COLES|nr:hypothetical protein [Colocasia esculenta]